MSDEERMFKLVERFTGERDVYVYATSKSEALAKARQFDIADADDPEYANYRYVGPVEEVLEPERTFPLG